MQVVARSNPECASSQNWFHQHFTELMSRCEGYFHFLPDVEQEEAVAETLAGIVQYVIRAAGREKLQRLTPYTLVLFFGRLCRAGRRMAGFRSTDAMSEVAQRRGHHKVHSLVEPVPIPTNTGRRVAPLREVLADSREDSPFENARRNLDYPAIVTEKNVGTKGRRVFQFLCETHGAGSHKELARELGVTAGRVSQIKNELAVCLARHGYGPPITRSSASAIGR